MSKARSHTAPAAAATARTAPVIQKSMSLQYEPASEPLHRLLSHSPLGLRVIKKKKYCTCERDLDSYMAVVSDSHYQATLDAVYVYLVPWSPARENLLISRPA